MLSGSSRGPTLSSHCTRSWYSLPITVPGYSKIANLSIKKDVLFEWSEVFAMLKQKLPSLVFPDFSVPFMLETDASKDGIGAVLAQRQLSGQQPMPARLSRVQSATMDAQTSKLSVLCGLLDTFAITLMATLAQCIRQSSTKKCTTPVREAGYVGVIATRDGP